MDERDIKKKVDEDWKKKVHEEKILAVGQTPPDVKASAAATSPVFMNFISNLAAQAMMHMGMMEHPMTGQREMDLDQAQYVIDLFKAVEEKTRGNLSKEEAATLKKIMNELMVTFVKLTEAQVPPPPRK